MIKAKGTRENGKEFYLLGLSSKNMVNLMQGKPIAIKLAEMGGPDIEILVIGGPTEEQLAQQLRPYFGPGMDIHPFTEPHA